jgi:hypothetical protein
MGRLVTSRADCCAISAHRHTTAHITVVGRVLCTGYVVNKTASCHVILVLSCDFGDNHIITIVKTGLTTKKICSSFVTSITLVPFHFVPGHFVPGHFVPVISSPHTFRPPSFCPRSFRPLVISSPRAESTEVHA